jgi:predicted LPLAT superfamily acyltransferase
LNFKYLQCVPTYNNPKTIVSVVRDLLSETSNDILIVDDGSDIPVEKLVRAEIQSDRLFFIRFNENKGKGLALQRAFEWAIENHYTHVISSDGDAQHPATEVKKIYARSLQSPWALIVGNRNMNTANVPGISTFGRKFSNFWVKYQTDAQVSDSQSGLRCYPLIHIQNWNFFTKRFDFEIEILIRLIWNEVEVIEEPVNVIYQKGEERVSHFDKLWDNVRITLLNTLLIILSLIKEQSSPFKLSLAFGMGIFIGCTPFYGLHFLICAAFSFFFKLNFVGLFAGSQISLPPLVPILVPTAKYLGENIAPSLSAPLSFFVGTSALGVILGTLGFTASWIFLYSRERSRKKEAQATPWKGEQRGGKFGNLFLKQLMTKVGLRSCYLFVAFFVVPYFYLFNAKARRAAKEYWKTLYPHENYLKRQGRVFKHMYLYATALLDSLYMSMLGAKSFPMRSSGYEELLKTLGHKKGVLMLTAHCGAFYLASRALGRHNFEYDIHIVRYEGQGLTFTQLQEDALAPKEIIINSQQLPSLEIRSALQKGGVVSMMGDRPIGNRLRLVKFMNKWVPVDLSPFRTAMACESAIFFGFGFKEAHGGYVFEVGHIKTEGIYSNKDEEACCLAQQYMNILESFVRKYPYQWSNWFEYFSFDKKLFSNNSPSMPHLKEALRKPTEATPDRSFVS